MFSDVIDAKGLVMVNHCTNGISYFKAENTILIIKTWKVKQVQMTIRTSTVITSTTIFRANANRYANAHDYW